MTERRLLGWVEVDSGTLLMGDPVYVLPRASDGKPGVDYQAGKGSSMTAIASMVSCVAVDDEQAWKLSDHCPVVAEFDV